MDNSDSESGVTLDRRTALKALSAGTAALALPGTGAAEHPGDGEGTDPFAAFPLELLNPRVRNAAHAWERGYVGRPDRSLVLTDSGVNARHGDNGPWNGVRTTNNGGSGDLTLADGPEGVDSIEDIDLPDEDDLPQFVAWHDDELQQPRDTSGHGNSVASIMQGSGRAWSLDSDSFLETYDFGGEEATELTGGETVEREFAVPSDAEHVFAGVAGNWLDVTLLGPDDGELASAFVAPDEVRDGAGSTAGFLTDGSTGSWDGERETLNAETVHDDDADEARTYALRIQPYTGDGSVTVELDDDDVYFVVIKLVSVPGDGTEKLPEGVRESLPDGTEGFVFNGAGVQAKFDVQTVHNE